MASLREISVIMLVLFLKEKDQGYQNNKSISFYADDSGIIADESSLLKNHCNSHHYDNENLMLLYSA